MSEAKPVRIAAILAAGGRGTRFAGSRAGDTECGALPKQLLELSGHPIYVWSLTTLLSQSKLEEVVIVAPGDLTELIDQQLDTLRMSFPTKALHVVAGGDTRQASVFCGLKFLKHTPPDYVLIHDAARPFLTSEILSRVLEGVTTFGACTAGIPPADTIKKVEGSFIAETLVREELLQVQTPQASKYDWLLAAHELAEQCSYATTDDAAVLEAAGHRVGIIRGASYNIKITQPEDLILAKALAPIVFSDRL